MRVVSFDAIASLGISPQQCREWVAEAILRKGEAQLPPKASLSVGEGSFINTMPSIVRDSRGRSWGGAKIVTRYPNREPSLDSKIILIDADAGDMLALMDADWITTMRTGAVAAHSIELLARPGFQRVSMVGLGNTARATMLMLADSHASQELHVRLLRYKDQAESFVERFAAYDNLHFEIVDDVEHLIRGAEVVVSCVSYLADDIAEDEAFDEGVLVVPVHTRGFTNCDLFFDKVFGDDYGHIHHFKNFDRFRSFAEVSDVVNGRAPGRESDRERILAYNIGLSIHDLSYAARIWQMVNPDGLPEIRLSQPTTKFWV